MAVWVGTEESHSEEAEDSSLSSVEELCQLSGLLSKESTLSPEEIGFDSRVSIIVIKGGQNVTKCQKTWESRDPHAGENP